jgi:hypothetical protein
VSAVLERLERIAEDSARAAERAQRVVELAREIGEDGLSELFALMNEDEPNGNGHSPKNGNGIVKPDGPRGREAVRQIVRDRPGIWTLAEIRAEMQEKGWFTTQKGLDAAVKRLCRLDHEGRSLGSGRYVFPADFTGEGVNDESDPSDGALIPLTP